MRKKEFVELCEASGAYVKDKLVMSIINYEKDFFSLEPEDWISIFKSYGKMHKSGISEIKREMTKVYMYSISKGLTIYNPFDSAILSVENISSQISSLMYVSQKQLSQAVEALNESLIGSCISQLIYEGAKSYLDIYNLNIEDIDYVNSNISFGNYVIRASEKLMKYIKEYDENDLYVSAHATNKTGYREFKMERVRDNSFVKIIKYETIKDEYDTFCRSCTYLFRKIGFSKQQVYNSGFFNFLYKKCDYSVNELTKLLIQEQTPYTKDKLENYANEYGVVKSSENIRFFIKEYLKSFTFQMNAIE